MKLIPKYLTGNVLLQYIEPKTTEGAIGKMAFLLIDPTGISSWPDAGNAWKNMFNKPNLNNLGNAAWETFGALPLIGKLKAPFTITKMTKLVPKAVNSSTAVVKTIDKVNDINKQVDTFLELIPYVKDVARWTQDKTSRYITQPLYNTITSNNKYDKVRNWRYGNGLIDVTNLSNTGVDFLQGINNINKVKRK